METSTFNDAMIGANSSRRGLPSSIVAGSFFGETEESVAPPVNPKYAKFVNTVDKAFGKWGSFNGVYVQPGAPGVLNPATGKYVGAGAVTYVPIKAIVSPVSQYMVDGKNVLASDVIIKVSPKGLTRVPSVSEKIKRGTETYTILNPKHIKPADTNIVLIYHARKD